MFTRVQTNGRSRFVLHLLVFLQAKSPRTTPFDNSIARVITEYLSARQISPGPFIARSYATLEEKICVCILFLEFKAQ